MSTRAAISESSVRSISLPPANAALDARDARRRARSTNERPGDAGFCAAWEVRPDEKMKRPRVVTGQEANGRPTGAEQARSRKLLTTHDVRARGATAWCVRPKRAAKIDARSCADPMACRRVAGSSTRHQARRCLERWLRPEFMDYYRAGTGGWGLGAEMRGDRAKRADRAGCHALRGPPGGR